MVGCYFFPGDYYHGYLYTTIQDYTIYRSPGKNALAYPLNSPEHNTSRIPEFIAEASRNSTGRVESGLGSLNGQNAVGSELENGTRISDSERMYSMVDMVNHPPHYTVGGIECIDAIQAQLTVEEFRGFLKGQVAKYNWREKHKNGTEDCKKAQWYLNRLIQFDTECAKMKDGSNQPQEESK